MKKHNSVFFNLICFILLFTVWGGFTSCKSVPTGNIVDPLNLLDNNSDFYIAIPKNADLQLIESVISKNIPGISKKDLKRISDRTSKVYCGIRNTDRGSFIQASIEGNIPLTFIPGVFSKKNGWNIRNSYSADSSDLFSYPSYNIYNSGIIDIAFPSSNIVCLGRDVESMLHRFNVLAYSDYGNGFQGSSQSAYIKNNSQLPDDLYLFLEGAENDIRFYSSDPKKFLFSLTGKNLDLKLLEIQGSLVTTEKYPDCYVLTMGLHFEENKFLKAGRAILKMVLGLTGINVDILDNNTLLIKDLLIRKEQLNDVLVL